VPSVKVLIFHGYLLRGTGSNVYTASLAAALAGLGHEVHLVCQDRKPINLAPPGCAGSVTVHNPDIGGLLPVFVHDTYEGFEVKTFEELSDAELDRYIEANVTAVRGLVGELGGIDAAVANHLVMGPVVLARAGLRPAAVIHGSDLSYTVIPDLERFGPYAQEACDGAVGILVGSGHIAARLRQAVDDPATNAKVRLGPPGVDTTLFSPIAPGERADRLNALATKLRSEAPSGSTAATESTSWDRDLDDAADAVDWFAASEGPRVIYVGKLIVSKGVDLLLAAWPLVHREHPGARLLVVGFGTAEGVLGEAWAGLAGGDLGPLRELAEHGRGLEGGIDEPLAMLSAFLDDLPDGYADAASAAAGSVAFSGRLEHDEVAVPVAASASLVFPSTFPEAFGMVAAEAAAAGALPVSAHHSGAAEVSRELAADLPADVARLVSFDLGPGAVAAIAANLNAWLGLPDAGREPASVALRETCERIWSWRGVARTVLSAAAGELDDLPVPMEE
jgi:glycosyltransferase involved in cell wall biosynthesis